MDKYLILRIFNKYAILSKKNTYYTCKVLVFLGLVMVQSIDNTFRTAEIDKFAFNNSSGNDDISIFGYKPDEDVEALKSELENITQKNGGILDTWNKIKEKTGLGLSKAKCEDAIEQYKAGEITYDEALEKIEKFGEKQDNSLNLFANIAVSALSIAAATVTTVLTGGAATPLLVAAVGAGVGAVTKAGIKTVDRATNEIKGDALDGKQIAKDALTGAVTGALAAKTMGNGKAVANHDIKKAILTNAPKCAVTGVKAGAISGSSNYLIDCAFEDDEDFNFRDFAGATVSNAAVGGVVGGLMGTFNGVMKTTGLISHGGQVNVVDGNIANAGIKDIAANSICSAEYKILTRGINDLVS